MGRIAASVRIEIPANNRVDQGRAMRRARICLIAGVCAVLAPAAARLNADEGEAARPAYAGIQKTGDEYVVIEAERANDLGAPFEIANDAQASGGQCALVPRGPGKTKNAGGRLTLRFRMAVGARYTLWARTLWKDGCGNSFDIALDGKPLPTVGQDGTYEVWHWVDLKMKKLDLAEGDHVFVITNKEDGIMIDQLLLTSDAGYVPVGIEK